MISIKPIVWSGLGTFLHILMKLLNIHFLLLLSSDDTERTVSELPCILMSVITVYTLTEHTQMNTLTLDLFLFIFITVSSFLFFWHIYTVIYEHTVKQRNMPIQVCSKKKPTLVIVMVMTFLNIYAIFF